MTEDHLALPCRFNFSCHRVWSVDQERKQSGAKLFSRGQPYNVVLTHMVADFDSLAAAVGVAKLWNLEDPTVREQVKGFELLYMSNKVKRSSRACFGMNARCLIDSRVFWASYLTRSYWSSCENDKMTLCLHWRTCLDLNSSRRNENRQWCDPHDPTLL